MKVAHVRHEDQRANPTVDGRAIDLLSPEPERLAEAFKALGDTTRVRIVYLLLQAGELCVCDIVDAFSLGQPAISHHLAVLRRAGIVQVRRRGQWSHYSLDENWRASFQSGCCITFVASPSASRAGDHPYNSHTPGGSSDSRE